MDADIKPTTFDLIVVGTGLPESILAGAAAQAGQSVLHLDPAASYGADWATLQLDAFMEWAKRGDAGASSLDNLRIDGTPGEAASEAPLEAAADSDLEVVPLSSSAPPLTHGFKFQLGGGLAQVPADELPASLGILRSYGVDLAGPRLALAAGPLVNLLIQCGAHNYLEFKAIEGCYTWHDGRLEPVPSSRADIFKSRSLSLVEKRHLTKFFKLVTEGIAEGGTSETTENVSAEELAMPFGDFLEKHKLPPSIRESLLYSVALLERDQDTDGSSRVVTREGLRAVTAYLQSVGRFGAGVGAFLYPLYGGGELPQAFCRIAAVKGALYVLRRGVRALLLDKASRHLRGVLTFTGQQILTSKLVAGPGLLEPSQSEPSQSETGTDGRNASGDNSSRAFPQSSDATEGHVCRCVCITDAPLTAGQSNVLVVFPPRSLSLDNPKHPVRVLQGGESAAICPPGRFLVQLSAVGSDNRLAVDVLQPAVEALFETRGEGQEESEQSGEVSDRARDADRRDGSPGARTVSDKASEEGRISQASRGATDEQRSPSQGGEGPSSALREGESSGRMGEENGSGALDASRADPAQAPAVNGETGASEEPGSKKPRVLWSVYFKQRTGTGRELAGTNIYQCSAPDASLTFDHVTKEVQEAFARLFPDVPFFPPQTSDAQEVEPEE